MLSFNKNSKELTKEISIIVLNDIKIRDNFKGGLPPEENSSGDESINSQALISERKSLVDIKNRIDEYKHDSTCNSNEHNSRNVKKDFIEQR